MRVELHMSSHPIDYRYGSKEMRAVWDEEQRLDYYLKVEAALARALAKLGKIPAPAAKEITGKADSKHVKLARVRAIEAETKHDVMAMVKALTEQCGEAGKYVHLTATSYDIVDTAQAIQLKEGLGILVKKGKKLLGTLVHQAEKHAGTTMVGRTHGQHALPITLGFKLANYAEKLGSGIRNLEWDRENLVQAKFSGAVGTYSAQTLYEMKGTSLEQAVMKELGLTPAPISTQVVARENIARIVADMAVVAGSLEQMAKEVRNLQRTEIGELGEPFGKSQVGSSTMAQKKNPVDCENVCANARVVRSCVAVALENIALEHERDLTNSASERSMLPTAFILLDDMLDRMEGVMAGLVVNEEQMRYNLGLTRGAIMAEALITHLVKKGIGRQDAHELMRIASQKAIREGRDLKEVILEDKIAMNTFSEQELAELLDYSNYTGQAIEKTKEIINKWGKWA
jgi:adenylosuccinate lyase